MKITFVQAVMRGYIVKRVLVRRKKAIKILDHRIHAFILGKREKKEFERSKISVVKMQSLARGRKGRKKYSEALYQKNVVQVQKAKEEAAGVIGQR